MSNEETQLTSDDLSLLDNGQQTMDQADHGDTSPDDGDDRGQDLKQEAGNQDKATDNKSPFGDGWRDDLVSNLPEEQQDKARNYLKTRSSPYDILRGAMSADQKISELTRDRVKIPTGENDDPKDVAAYRKARGVPESWEKYDVRIPEDFGELTELDNELKDEFLKKAHAQNWGQKDIDLALETHVANMKMLKAEEARHAMQASEKAVDDLRIEYGSEYRPNVELVNRMLAEELSERGITDPQERHNLLSKRFADGVALGETKWFVDLMIKFAKERADAGDLVMGETVDGGDLATREKEIMKLMHSDPKEYERMQPELQKIIAAQERRKARGR